MPPVARRANVAAADDILVDIGWPGDPVVLLFGQVSLRITERKLRHFQVKESFWVKWHYNPSVRASRPWSETRPQVSITKKDVKNSRTNRECG